MAKGKLADFSEVARTKPDGKGRIALGKFAKGVSSFAVHVDSEGRLLLEPYAEVPAVEKWLFENKEAKGRVFRGLAEVAEGKTSYLGSFSRHADEPLD